MRSFCLAYLTLVFSYQLSFATAPTGRYKEVVDYMQQLQAEMIAAAEALEFERAAAIRDQITTLQSAGDRAETAPSSGRSAPTSRARRPNRRRRGGTRVPRPKRP